ncbi:hypothetical protein V6N13_142366 [Hibiscus sabdariffa]
MRFGNCQEASRAVGRLNGFNQYKFQLNVAFATGKRKANHVVESVQKVWVPQRNTDGVKVKTGNDTTEELIQRGWVTGESSEKASSRLRSIDGLVVEEDLWKLRRFLVGEMATICSVKRISDRLLKWGLVNIKVQRMGGKSFLLSFDVDELFLMLEDLDWSYLKEIFSVVRPWSDSWEKKNGVTWIEVSGLPLHCWNYNTLKRLAGFWGSPEAYGENVNHTLNRDVVEVGFCDIMGESFQLRKTSNDGADQGHEVNNKSESSSEVAKKPLPVMSVRKKNKACNTECFGFNSIDEVLGDMAYINPSFMRVAVDDKNMRLSPLVSYFDSSPEVSLAKEKSDGHEELNIESGPPRKEDKKFEEPGFDKPGSEQSSSDNEEFDSFFHEMGSIRLHKKGKKYVLMMEFEEKALTEVERKKTK